MTSYKTLPIPVRDLESQTDLSVEDNGDGVVGEGDVIRSPEGEAVSTDRARQDFFLSRARNHLSAWDGALRQGAELPAGIPQPTESTILARAREMRSLADDRAGNVSDPVASEALLTRANALGLAAEKFGSRTFGIPDEETRNQFTDAFKSVVEAAHRDPESETAWVAYGMTIGNTYRSAPGFYHSTMEKGFGISFETEITTVEENLAQYESLPANLGRAFLYTATREKSREFGEALDPEGTKLNALMDTLAEQRSSDPEGFDAKVNAVMRGDAAESIAKKLLKQLRRR